MRRIVKFLVIALLISACNGNNKSSEEKKDSSGTNLTQSICFVSDSLYIHKSVVEGQDIPNYSIELNIVYTSGQTDIEQNINEHLSELLFMKSGNDFKAEKDEFVDSLSKAFTDELTELYEPEYEDIDRFQYTYNLKSEVHNNARPGIVAYTIKNETYLGGAHGGYYATFVNFSKTTGKVIGKEDVFEDNEDVVIHMIEEQLMKDNGCQTLEELAESTGITMLGNVFISDNNFLLLNDCVLFLFNPYEIAPWSTGTINVKLTYDQLKDIIK